MAPRSLVIDRGRKERESRDTGMAAVLVAMILLTLGAGEWLLWVAIGIQVATMTAPKMFWPLAGPWFGLSRVLGTWMSRVVLALIFFAVVVPVAVLRRLMGKDSLRLAAFKRGDGSVLIIRNHRFAARDLETPY